MTVRLAAAALLVFAGFALLGALLLPDPGAARVVTHAVAPAAVVVHHEARAGGTDVSGSLDADRAFLADLFDGAATDLDPQTAADLVATAHRICDLGQSRADWLASLTVGPHALTDGEATKLVDTAQAAYCPETAAAEWGGLRG